MTRFRAAYKETASVYLRNVCGNKTFLSYPGIAPDTFVYILDSKTLAGREPRDALDAHSRPLVVSFFQKVPGHAPDDGMIIVERCDKSFAGMSTKTLTCAELLLALGYNLEADPSRNLADTESVLEDAHDHVQRLVWQHAVYLGLGVDVHTYRLTDPVDAEDDFFESTAPDEHTKFVLARALERRHGWNRRALWNLRVPDLLAALTTDVCPPGCDLGGGDGRGGRGRRGGRGGRAGRRGRGRGPAVVAAPAAAPAAAAPAPGDGGGRGHRGGRGRGGGRRGGAGRG